MVRGLENVEVPEGGEALFECHLSLPEVAAHTWLLDDQPVSSSENAEVVYFENGLRHLLLLKNLRPQDSCRVTFLAGDVVTSAFLTVRGGCAGRRLCDPPSGYPAEGMRGGLKDPPTMGWGVAMVSETLPPDAGCKENQWPQGAWVTQTPSARYCLHEGQVGRVGRAVKGGCWSLKLHPTGGLESGEP